MSIVVDLNFETLSAIEYLKLPGRSDCIGRYLPVGEAKLLFEI